MAWRLLSLRENRVFADCDNSDSLEHHSKPSPLAMKRVLPQRCFRLASMFR